MFALAADPDVAIAAPAADPEAPVEAGREDIQLTEVVVSSGYVASDKVDMATGLGLTPRETPQSVSVITAQRIRDQNLDTVADVIINAVGVSANEIDDVRNTFNARGFEITNYQVDGVPLAWSLAGDSGETIVDVALYDRIEIVRGATGLLTGAGDPSASVNLVRKHADSTQFQGYLNASVGSWNNRQVTVDLSSGLNSTGSLRGRVVAKYERGESYEDLYEDDISVFYGVFEADITPNTLLRVGASDQHNDPGSPTWGALPSWYSDGSRTDFARSTTTAADWTRWRTINKNYFANLIHGFSNGWTLIANYNRLENEQKTRLLYLSGTLDEDTGEGLVSYPYRSSGASEQDSVDIQLKGYFDWLGRKQDFVLGALYSQQEANTDSYAAVFAAPYPDAGSLYGWDGSYPEPEWSSTADTAVDLETEQQGLYGALHLSLAEPLRLIVGGRLADWERTGVNYGVDEDFGDDGVFIPYAGVLYDLSRSHRLYASYTEIFKPQNARTLEGEVLDPVVGKSYETGLKSTFLDEALQTSVALFRIEQDNLGQAIAGGIVAGTVMEQAYRAAEGTTSEGFELEVVGAVAPGWNLSIGFTQFTAEDAAGQDVSTDQPRRLLKIFSTHRFTGVLQGLTVGGGFNWQDEIDSGVSANPVTGEPERLEQGAYTLVNLMARYDVNERLSLQFNAHNLTDEKYYSQVGFYSQYRYGDPRNYSFGVNYRF